MRHIGKVVIADLDLSRQERARMNMLLVELRRRNRDFLLLHARFMELNAEILNLVAARVKPADPGEEQLTEQEARDIVKCAVASYAYIDLEEGADNFAELMAHPISWNEKMALIKRGMMDFENDTEVTH